MLSNSSEKILLTYIDYKIPAGFPSPATDYIEQRLDLNERFIIHPNSTFIIRVKGNSMVEAGIHDDDFLIVDKSIKPATGQIVIAEVNGDYTIKRIDKIKDKLYLVAANEKFEPMLINEESEFQVWGVVTYCIHKTN